MHEWSKHFSRMTIIGTCMCLILNRWQVVCSSVYVDNSTLVLRQCSTGKLNRVKTQTSQNRFFIKVSLLWVMKGSYFGFGIPNNRLTCMQALKTLSFSYNMHLFLPYLLNDSQTIHSTIHFSKPLLCVTLICSDWSILFKAEHSVTLCTALPGKQIFLSST